MLDKDVSREPSGFPTETPSLADVSAGPSRSNGRLDATIITDEDGFSVSQLHGWDGLAEFHSKPFCSPAWALAWWRNCSPEGAKLAVVVVENHEGTLMGVAPFYIDRRKAIPTIRLLGAKAASGVDLLSVPGKERPVAEAIAGALRSRGRWTTGIVFDGVPTTSPWPALLGEVFTNSSVQKLPQWRQLAPIVRWPGDKESWVQSRSSNFRQQMRRKTRQFENDGGKVSFHNLPDERAIARFVDLHLENWNERGGSAVLGHGSKAMIAEAASELGPKGRFALWTMEATTGTACSLAFISAGDRAEFWLGGYDEDWSHLSPTLIGLFAAIQGLMDEGFSLVSLGSGPQPYKYRFTSDDQELVWVAVPTSLFARGFAPFMFLRTRLRTWIASHLSDRFRHRIKGALRKP